MSSDERSPKRQRGSYSPASPSYISAAQTKPFVNAPQTPPPSVRMSPSWDGHLLPSQISHTTFPTPPSTAGLNSQMREAPTVNGDQEVSDGSAHHTPTEGNEQKLDVDGDTQMDQSEVTEGDISMADARHRRTDHDRLEGEDASLAKTDIKVDMSKDTQSGSNNSAEESIVLYKLATEPIAPSRPHPSQDLIGLYDLRQIQASVARKDPVTGEKINKLRKSYEGQLKMLRLEGRNKAAPNQGELLGLLDPGWDFAPNPNEATWWERERVIGREINSQHTTDLFSKLDSALAMTPGHLPKEEHEKFKSMLGLDDAAAAKPTPNLAPTKNAAQYAMSKTHPTVRAFAPASPRNGLARPERANKKRRYDDSSFPGYNDGYPDDDGYSTGGMDERRGSNSKKRRKVSIKPDGYYANPNGDLFQYP